MGSLIALARRAWQRPTPRGSRRSRGSARAAEGECAAGGLDGIATAAGKVAARHLGHPARHAVFAGLAAVVAEEEDAGVGLGRGAVGRVLAHAGLHRAVLTVAVQAVPLRS